MRRVFKSEGDVLTPPPFRRARATARERRRPSRRGKRTRALLHLHARFRVCR